MAIAQTITRTMTPSVIHARFYCLLLFHSIGFGFQGLPTGARSRDIPTAMPTA